MKIGFIIADKDELKSIDFESLNVTLNSFDYHGMSAVSFDLNGNNIVIVLCGIGLTCAASACAYLCADNVDIIVNAGLSGSISALKVNDLFICESVAEHDSDLTPIGFEPGKRPDLPVYFNSSEKLVDFFKKNIPFAKSGVSASGNGFIASSEQKKRIFEQFSAKCCDMEYSAIALVCNREHIPCVSIRKISDSADDVANIDYGSYDIVQTRGLFDIVLDALSKIDSSVLD